MIYNIIVEPEAIQDLFSIKAYITKEDTQVKADIFLSELKSKIKSLENNPQRCRRSFYTQIESTHDLIHKGYTIVYKIIKHSVHILTIFRQKNY